LRKILGGFIEQHRLMLRDEAAPTLADCGHHVVSEICEILIEEEEIEADVENGLNTVGVQALGSPQRVARRRDPLCSGNAPFARPGSMSQSNG
jgi:hypothetical protein